MRTAVSGQHSAVSEQLAAQTNLIPRPGVWRWLRLTALSIINLFVALLWLGLAAWLVGRVLTDRLPWSQWLWWIPTPAAVTAAIVGFLLSFRIARTPRRRRRRILVWSACAAALSIQFSLIEHRLLHAAPPLPVSPSKALTIAHWNITQDRYSDTAALMRAIASLDADVLAITSPTWDVRRLVHEQVDASAGRLHMFDGWPMLLLSRVPIDRARPLVAADLSFVTRIELDAGASLGRAITVDLVDLPSTPKLSRMNVARTVRGLLDAADSTPPDLAIGDFNITRNSASLDALYPGMIDAYDEAGHGYGASFHRRFPLYHIDHIMIRADSGLRAARYDILDEGLSRHDAQKAWITAR